jgi:RNA polymerase sigma-70 factor (ECF subfamily)
MSDDKNIILQQAFDRFNDGMVFYAGRWLENRVDAEDVVQELYIRLWEMPNLTFDNERTLKSYLYKMVRNACLNRIGQKDVLRNAIDLIVDEIREERHVSFDETVAAEILSGVERLPHRTKMIFISIFFEGKKYQQAADEMEISVNTVKTLLKNGVKQLRKYFSGRESILKEYILPEIAFLIHIFAGY